MGGRLLGLLSSVIFVCCVFGPYQTQSASLGPDTSSATIDAGNYLLDFHDVPNIAMYVRKDGVVQNYTQYFLPLLFAEVDNSTGSAVKGKTPNIVNQGVIAFNTSLDWTESISEVVVNGSLIEKQVNFSTILKNGAFLRLTHYYFANSHFISFPAVNYSRTLVPHTWKFSFELDNWPTQNMSNVFLFHMRSSADPYFIGPAYHVKNNHEYNINVSWGYAFNNATENLHLPTFVQEDGLWKELIIWYDFYDTIILSVQGVPTFLHYFYYPMWKNSFLYDPDLSVLVNDNAGSSSPTGTGGGGSSNSQLLVEILVPVLVGLALVIVVVVIVVLVVLGINKNALIRRKLTRAGSAASVNAESA